MATNSKLLTEGGWRAAARDVKVRDKDLRRALLDYQDAPEEELELRLRSIARIKKCASTLEKDRAVTAAPELSAYLSKLIGAAQAEERGLQKERAGAQKAGPGDEEEDEAEEYPVQLEKALARLKTAKKPFHVVVCLARPYCMLTLSKTRLTTKHLKRLSALAGGSRRFLPPGTCTRDGVSLLFELRNAPPGLAREILRSIKHFTGKKFKVKVGGESAEDEGEAEVVGGVDTASGQGAALAREAGVKVSLEKTPEVWDATRRAVRSRIEQLAGAIRKAFAGEGAGIVAGVEGSVKVLDRVFERLDDDLVEILRRASASQGSERSAELGRARKLLASHVQYVKSEPMIAHIDANPFGVKTDLQVTLTKSLRHVLQAIGTEHARQ